VNEATQRLVNASPPIQNSDVWTTECARSVVWRQLDWIAVCCAIYVDRNRYGGAISSYLFVNVLCLFNVHFMMLITCDVI
jgi:hypothetical protein